MMEKSLYDRYQRQIILKGFGETAQQKLEQAKVLVIGAGGLGCAALQYMVAAGIGHMGIVDDDTVSVSNLHRQVLYSMQDVGQPKALVAKEKLQMLNPGVEIVAHYERLVNENCLSLVKAYDIIMDGTDNFASRYMINDACVLLGKPLVFGAVSQYEGQVAVFNVKKADGNYSVNYRDLFPDPPKDGEVLNCAEAGVLGVLPGIIGTMQATEIIKLITGIGKSLVDELLTYNALNQQTLLLTLQQSARAAELLPETTEAFLATDYGWLCGAVSTIKEISAIEFSAMTGSKNILVVDVRELYETPEVTEFEHAHIPLSVLDQRWDDVKNEEVIFFCQSGRRSLKAASMAAEYFGEPDRFSSLQGGIGLWKEMQKQMI